MGYSLSETIKGARTQQNIRLVNPQFWIEDISLLDFPKCYTLNSTAGYGSVRLNALSIKLSSKLDYRVYIHGSSFFYPTINPKTTPRTLINVDKDYGQQVIYIEEVLNTKLNKPSQPCNQTPEYSFTRCLKNKIR